MRAINETAEILLGLVGKVTPGDHCRNVLDTHPKIVRVLQDTCVSQTGACRQELVTQRPDGEKMVVGYSTVVMKNASGEPIGIAMSFQDITRLIPLMDSEQFLNIALKNMPGGLIFVDVQGRIRGVNEMARKILGIQDEIDTGLECHKALSSHPHVYKVLLSTCESLTAVNRREITTRRSDGEKVTIGYGTLILKNAQGKPIGVGMTFQDITRNRSIIPIEGGIYSDCGPVLYPLCPQFGGLFLIPGFCGTQSQVDFSWTCGISRDLQRNLGLYREEAYGMGGTSRQYSHRDKFYSNT